MELAEARNVADQAVYSARKALTDNKGKVPSELEATINEKITALDLSVDRVVNVLANRLLRHATPIPDQPLARPLIVSGMPRSGTTYLHRLLASVPETRALKLWELQRLFAPLAGADRRRAGPTPGCRR